MADTLASADRDAMVRDILGRIGDKWSVIVICKLGHGELRFNALRRQVDGITQRMLSATLRGLERDGIVSRTVHPTVPPQVEYALTETGQGLLKVVQSLAYWTEDHVDAIRAAREAYDGRAD